MADVFLARKLWRLAVPEAPRLSAGGWAEETDEKRSATARTPIGLNAPGPAATSVVRDIDRKLLCRQEFAAATADK
jgi:hypothetical protein